MTGNAKNLFINYLEQMAELNIPPFFFTPEKENASVVSEETRETQNSEPSLKKAPPQSYEQKRKVLAELYYSVTSCKNCQIGALRKKLVFGSGNANASIMIIGEAPGEEEDRQGLPFVGKAGELLTKMLAAINLDRQKDVFITNILKCRPPGNRNPETSEIQACSQILDRQIDIINPKAVLILGKIAAHYLLNRFDSINDLRGKKLHINNHPAIVTYHPAALLYNASLKKYAWQDLQLFQKLLKEMNIYGSVK